MAQIVAHFANGNILFVGLLLTVAACILQPLPRSSVLRATLATAGRLGALLVILSAAPLPLWAYLAWAVALGLCLFAARRPGEASRRALRPLAGAGLLLVSLGLAWAEGSRLRAPSIPIPKDRPVAVIGDSISAGIGNRIVNWPVLLAGSSGLAVTNLAEAGCTTRDAMDQALRVPDSAGLVILEIGGNDLLGDTSAGQFEKDLRALLSRVCRPGRTVVMFELPLPPFCNRYGIVQRECARAFGVTLIPKRFLAGVLGSPGATLDSLHLSQAGHERMAAVVRGLIP